MCPEHQDRAAVDTCVRCGRFLCAECGGDDRICPACLRRRVRDLPGPAPRTLWAVRCLAASAVGDGASMLLSIWALSSSPAPEENAARDLVETAHSLAIVATAIATIVGYLRWLHLAVRHAGALGIDVGASPGWAVGWWFVPFANLVKPYLIVRDLVAGLIPERAASVPVSAWWAAWIVGNMVDQAEIRLLLRADRSPDPLNAGHIVGIVSGVIGIASALVCVKVVRAVQRGLSERRA